MEGQVPKVVPVESSKIPAVALGSSESGLVPILLTSKDTSASKKPSVSPSPGVYLSEKDPILIPSQDSRLSVGIIRHEVGSKVAAVEQNQETPL
ncbi:hypothetical protein Lser_V15G18170 [Lactuca serriola]